MSEASGAQGVFEDWLAEYGRRLADGYARFLNDAAETLPPRVGRATPRRRLISFGSTRLYRYTQTRGPGSKALPLLIVYAMVNRPGVLDLTPDRSLIRALVEQGHRVYLVDWGDPSFGDSERPLADYVLERLGQAVDAVLADAGAAQLALMGVCQGGVFSLCHAAARPQRIARLITTVTPVDFHTPADRLSALARGMDPDMLIASGAPVPGHLLNVLFRNLKPLALGHKKYVDLVGSLGDPRALNEFLAMEAWLADSPAQPGRALGEFIAAFYRDNRLVEGGLELGGEGIALAALRMPVLNIHATRDHIVPPAASLALNERTGGPCESLAVEGGHIGLFVGGRALAVVPDAIAAFIR